MTDPSKFKCSSGGCAFIDICPDFGCHSIITIPFFTFRVASWIESMIFRSYSFHQAFLSTFTTSFRFSLVSCLAFCLYPPRCQDLGFHSTSGFITLISLIVALHSRFFPTFAFWTIRFNVSCIVAELCLLCPWNLEGVSICLECG